MNIVESRGRSLARNPSEFASKATVVVGELCDVEVGLDLDATVLGEVRVDIGVGLSPWTVSGGVAGEASTEGDGGSEVGEIWEDGLVRDEDAVLVSDVDGGERLVVEIASTSGAIKVSTGDGGLKTIGRAVGEGDCPFLRRNIRVGCASGMGRMMGDGEDEGVGDYVWKKPSWRH